jgi:hypothetical protein
MRLQSVLTPSIALAAGEVKDNQQIQRKANF